MITKDDFTRVNNDINGNPRYVIHFSALITDKDRETRDARGGLPMLSDLYPLALQRAKQIGGKKFHNKQYGGGIVFQSYELRETIDAIARVLEA